MSAKAFIGAAISAALVTGLVATEFAAPVERTSWITVHGGTATTPISVHRPGKTVTLDHDCSDFSSWSEAQAWHRAHPGHNLDSDNDGIVYERLRRWWAWR